MPNDRSDAALRERLEIAGEATPGPWYHVLAAIVGTKESPDDDNATCICFTEWGASGDPQANAAHIAASSPDVVRADIEEILRLRQEVARLEKEADWLVKIMFFYTEECPLKMKIQDELPIPKLDGCSGAWPDNDYFDCAKNTPRECWRDAARKAVEEEENGYPSAQALPALRRN